MGGGIQVDDALQGIQVLMARAVFPVEANQAPERGVVSRVFRIEPMGLEIGPLRRFEIPFPFGFSPLAEGGSER